MVKWNAHSDFENLCTTLIVVFFLLQIAAVLDRDRSKYKVVVELIQTGEIVTLDYDDVCEYTGDTEDM